MELTEEVCRGMEKKRRKASKRLGTSFSRGQVSLLAYVLRVAEAGQRLPPGALDNPELTKLADHAARLAQRAREREGA